MFSLLFLFTKKIKCYNIKLRSYHCMCNDGWLSFYLMTHSTHFIYSYMASDIW